jgi:predicted DNA-binding transcriptional regulator YafY
MSTQGTIHSYYLIIDKLRKAPYPTKKELFEYLYEEGLVYSIRSLERRIEEIRTEFHLDIPYNPRTNSYSLSDEDQKSLNDLLRFLELNTITRIFGDSIKVSREAIKHFSFDTDGSFHGIAILKPLLNAIQTRHRINFSYQKFQENSASERKDFCPLILREYLGRWYIGGNFQESDRLFTFGLDRMNSLKISEETFIPILENPASMFDSVIGVAIMEPVIVELAFSYQQAKYIKTLPLHQSQEIVSENNDEVIFRYFVATNYELVQRILMYGNEVRVLKPENLIDDIKYILKESLNKYISK